MECYRSIETEKIMGEVNRYNDSELSIANIEFDADEFFGC